MLDVVGSPGIGSGKEMSPKLRRWQGLLWWMAPCWRLSRCSASRPTGEGRCISLPAAPQRDRGQGHRSVAVARIPGRSRRRQPERDRRSHAVQPDPAPGAAGDRRPPMAARRPSNAASSYSPARRLQATRSIAFLKEVAERQGAYGAGRRQNQRHGGLGNRAGPRQVHLDGDVEELTLKVAAGPKANVAAAPATGGPAVAGGRTGGGFGRRAGAAAGATGEGAPPPNVAARRAASRAAAAAAAEQAPAGAAAPPASNTSSDPWANVYQKMQQGDQRTSSPDSAGATDDLAGRLNSQGKRCIYASVSRGDEHPMVLAWQEALRKKIMFKRNPLPYIFLTATFLLTACAEPYRPVRDPDARTMPTGPLLPSTPATTSRNHFRDRACRCAS